MAGTRFNTFLRQARRPVSKRRRYQRWTFGALATMWLAYLIWTGSLAGSLLALIILALLGACAVAVLRSMRFNLDDRLVRRLRERPWRDGQKVLELALTNLREVFVITPLGAYLAPSKIDLRMNPADLESLQNYIDLELVEACAVEAYETEIMKYDARVLRDVSIQVSVVGDADVPVGRYQLRQHRQLADHGIANPGDSGTAYPVTSAEESEITTLLADGGIIYQRPGPPLLRLVTGSIVSETTMTPARAGRSRAVELRLPEVPTISRVHATFTCIAGQWCMTSEATNGAMINGVPVTHEHLIHDRDLIRWGGRADAVTSRVEIDHHG